MPKSKNGFIDFKALKQRVQIIDVLEYYGLTGTLRVSGNTLVGPCPICGGEGDRFRVSTEKNVWNCFGKDCKGGNSLDFVANKESVPLREAAGKIVEWLALDLTAEPLPGSTSQEKPRKEDASTEAVPEGLTVNKVLSFTLQHLDSSHPYLTERGLTTETVETFGLGYCDRGIMKGRVVIPLHNHDGELVAYMGRWPGDPPEGEPRYKLPKGFQKSLELFNTHRPQEHADNPLIIVEGAFSAMKIHQAGFPRVVALLGSNLSEFQEGSLLEMVGDDDRILLSLDGDEAGERAKQEILPRLARKAYVATVSYPEGHLAPDTMPIEAIVELFGHCNRRGEVA
jgi:DNA primase